MSVNVLTRLVARLTECLGVRAAVVDPWDLLQGSGRADLVALPLWVRLQPLRIMVVARVGLVIGLICWW